MFLRLVAYVPYSSDTVNRRILIDRFLKNPSFIIVKAGQITLSKRASTFA